MKDGQMTFFQNPTEIENLKSVHSFVIFFPTLLVNNRIKDYEKRQVQLSQRTHLIKDNDRNE